MSSNVVPLKGDGVPQLGEVQPDCVALAERLLDMARSGELQALGAVLLYRDTACAFETAGLAATYSVIGAATVMIARLSEETLA